MRLTVGRSLDKLKEIAATKVDVEAEQQRGQFITPGSGQAMVYLEKERQARGYLADSTQEAFEHIHLEATATGKTPEQVATEILAKAGEWRQVSAVIESKRLGAKKAISDASTSAEIDAASTVDWTI